MLNSSYKKKNIDELIILAQQDDKKAIEALIKLTQKDIHTTLSYLLRNKNEVHDLTQTVLIKMIQNIKKLKFPNKFKPWLNKIISNAYYDELRKIKRTCEHISIDKPECQELHDNKKSCPIEKCISNEIDKFVKNSILNLPTHFKIAIILREFGGLSYQEIADITHTGLGTVKSRIARARNILQNNLKSCI